MAFSSSCASRFEDHRGARRPGSKILTSTPTCTGFPRELSGVSGSVWRWGAPIVRDPKVFLFDSRCRTWTRSCASAMRGEIKALHQRLKTTTVYVTHDQVDAMTMATASS